MGYSSWSGKEGRATYLAMVYVHYHKPETNLQGLNPMGLGLRV